MEIKKLLCQSREINGKIKLPTSKSISNRLLIIQALSAERFRIENLSEAKDTMLMQKLLNQIASKNSDNNTLTVNAEDAGTVFRFLTAFLSTQMGYFFLTGSERMQQRPIRILVDALQQLGANINYTKKEGLPPLSIKGQQLSSKYLTIQANISSQFISALLMIAPALPEGLIIQFEQKPISLPYINMTLELMRKFGIKMQNKDHYIEIHKSSYQATETVIIEADWSSASFWYQAVAFSKSAQLILQGLKLSSVQGDSILPKIYKQLGVKTTEVEHGILIQKEGVINYNFNFDFSHYPDLALPVIATCAGLGVIGKFSGLASLKIKESNRIAVLETELAKLGFDFRETDVDEWVLINSCNVNESQYDFSNIIINTYEDHRVAMSFAPFAILGKGIQIANPCIVEKSYPRFWDEIDKII